MFAATFAFMLAIAKLYPETPIGKAINHMMVAWPLDRLSRMSRTHVIFSLALIVMLVAGAEMIAIVGSADIAVMMAWDVALYVDITLTAITLAAVARGKGAWQALRAVPHAIGRRLGVRPRQRRRGAHAEKPKAPPSNDDHLGERYLLAA